MNSHLRLLLQLVNSNADISHLLKSGLTYSQIAELFGEAIRNGLIIHAGFKTNGNNFFVTDQGNKLLSNSESSAILGVQGRWISPDERNKCAQIELDDVFLPKEKHSYF
jgi:hypothetical protein